MGIFDSENPRERRTERFRPFYRVYTVGTDGDEIDHDPDCVIEAVPVGSVAHYVVKKQDGTVDAYYPFNSVECIWRVTQEDTEEA